jgi:hypothetical protein
MIMVIELKVASGIMERQELHGLNVLLLVKDKNESKQFYFFFNRLYLM